MTSTKRVVCVGLAALVVLPVLAACSRDKVRAGEARVDPNGVVEVMKPGGSWKPVKETKTVKNGDKVRVLSGDAQVLLPSAELALRSGSELLLAQSPELLRGDLLVVPESRSPLSVKSAGSDFGVVGAARLTRSFAVTAASYFGVISVRSAGSTLGIPALRQATVAALGSEVPRAAEPLRYQDKDPWDRRFLAEAIDLGNVLQARSEAGTNQFRGQGASVGFYRILFPELTSVADFDRPLLDASRPAGENIVGAAIALKGRQGGGFGQRWQRIFAFRSEGATWGLVALDQQVHKVPDLVRRIDDAFGGAGLPGSPGRVAFGTTTTTGQPSPTTATTSAPSTTQTTRGSDPGPPTPPTTSTTLLPEPPPTGILPIDNTGNQTVDTINGLLGGLVTAGR